jgi:nitrogen fixation protein NifB
MKLAICTSDGARVDTHFGKAERFLIADVSADDYSILETRELAPGCGDCGNHNDGAISDVAAAISDCSAVIAVMIGKHAMLQLRSAGIACLEFSGGVEDALGKYKAFLNRGNPLRPIPEKSKAVQTPPRVARRRDLASEHPCFAAGRPNNNGRIHLPVAPVCNIACRFCSRSQNNETENRPGVSRALIAPEDAPAIVNRALLLCPSITVIGIAGPGDALASPDALDTLRLVHEAFPELIKCVSTNGLALPGKAKLLADAGVSALTVTVNAVDAGVLKELVDCRDHDELIHNQLTGIREAAEYNIRVKVNTVLVPEINGAHIADVSRAVKAAGADMQNILPVIPNNKLSRVPAPSCEQIEDARRDAGEHLTQFRHCAHCRADAIGVPGVSDFSAEIYGNLRITETFSHG